MNRIESKPTNNSATNVWQLHDWERQFGPIDSQEALERMIRELPESGSPPNRIVDLESPNGDKLSFGIAGPNDGDNRTLTQALACVQFTNASLDPPYLIPVGDASLNYENGGVLVFHYDGSWTEILRRNCVPLEAMIRIAQHFYQNGTLPTWIAWEEA